MAASKPIQIVGGGLAGLTLGIALRRNNVPVTIFEAGNYPRHRVCGEFINGRGLDVLDRLSLKQRFFDAGAIRAENAAFFVGATGSSSLRLPAPAVCLSRFAMDKLLADEFQKLGGDLRTGTRFQVGLPVGVQALACPDTLKRELQQEGTVRASGRRLQAVEKGWRWFGLKAHAKNVALMADLEMHLLPNGYVGLCRLAGGEVNVCGLFRRRGENDATKSGFDLLRGNPGSVLHDRLQRAEFVEDSFCSVAGLSLRPQRAAEKPECCIGDALTMIPPVTGNGMSLAFESAELAADPVTAFSRGERSWTETEREVAQDCDHHFNRRLRWAGWLQQAMFCRPLQPVLLALVSRSNHFWRTAFERTR